MSGIKKNYKIAGIVILAFAIAIGLFYSQLTHSIKVFNETEHSTIDGDESVTFTVAPRGGATDSWTKILSDETTITGSTYDASVYNSSPYAMSSWTMKINFHQDCYINNGWCGKFEVHQFADGAEKSQLIDLRDYGDPADLEVDYLMEGQDLMIPLHDGDYIVYYPNAEVYEYPISQDGGSATVGFILYTLDEMDLSDSVTIYYYNETLEQTVGYKYLIGLCILWIITFIAYVSVLVASIFSNRALSRKEKEIEEAMDVFSGFVDAKDPYTKGHSTRVAEYSKLIAEALGYTDEQLRNVYYIGLMHDCGKCYIPDEILKKPSSLTSEEFAVIKEHTVKGAELLKNFDSIPGIIEGALNHHERYDGTGYPYGKKGEEIPEIGRIIAIADAYDAMNSKRVYRDSLSKEAIREELVKGRGTQFDPKLVDVFMDLIKDGKVL